MLGRLFSSASSTATSPSGTRPSTSHALESDEIHTRNLLYPDTSSVASSFHSSYSFAHSQSSTSSISAGDNIDLDAARDVRIVIAQDAIASEHKVVVYDSKSLASAMLDKEDIPVSPTLGGPYSRSRRRNLQYPVLHNTGPDDELRVFTDCMFGSAPLSYKGPSTKVHILPTLEERRPSVTATSPTHSRRGSLRGGSNGVQSFGPQPPPQLARDKRKSVLITRLFSVAVPPCPTSVPYDGGRNIPPPGGGDNPPTPTSSVGSTNGFPFPRMGGGQPNVAPKITKPPKTSMYAVGLVVSLPPVTSSSSSLPIRCCSHKQFASYDNDYPHLHRHEYCCPTPPSFDDDYPTISPTNLRPECGLDDVYSAASANDGRMDLVTKHWDVITRALSDLQRVAQARILENLVAARLASPHTLPQNGAKYLSNKTELRKLGLMRDEVVRGEVERLRWRVVSGIKLPHVVVGQGRWDVWQDEAKWANHRFGGRDMNFFFLTLLTAFLGHHTDWLGVLGPEAYKRRHFQQQRMHANPEESATPTRTVLLSSDRIAARRLIYLLSAFLPAKPHQTLEALPPPSRTSSINNYLSQSPPSSTAAGSASAPGSKTDSLRQKARKKPSKLNMAVSSEDSNSAGDDGISGWTIPHDKPSIAASVLQLPSAPEGMRKPESSEALIGGATSLPSSANSATSTPVSPQKMGHRPGSAGSVASLNLKNTLKRTGTANTVDSNGTWGSFLSFWSHKSRSSTATSETSLQIPDEAPFTCNRTRSSDRLEDDEPVDVGELCLEDDLCSLPQHRPPISPLLGTKPYQLIDQVSIDEEDGAINVPLDLSFPPFSSPISSPPSSSWAMPPISGNFDRTFIPATPRPPLINPHEDDSTCNVAGWIDDERFHPDFLLQAVKPYPEVEADIKRAMRMEPTPLATGLTPLSETGSTCGDKWVTVSEVLVADTKRLQIKRLRLRRRVKRLPSASTTPVPCQYQRYLQPLDNSLPTTGHCEDAEEEEILDQEIVCDVDDTLATAIEQVIGALPNGDETSEGSGCKHAVLGALERVVGEVVKGGGEQGERWGGNVLTEGVGRWICGVEETI